MEQRQAVAISSLSALLADFEPRIADLSSKDLSVALGHFERIRSTLWARIFQPRTNSTSSSADNDQRLSVAEAAKLLNISKTKLRRIEKAGGIVGARFGRRLTFRREVVLRYAEDLERNGAVDHGR
jgi:excisionase family DNA binding protein